MLAWQCLFSGSKQRRPWLLYLTRPLYQGPKVNPSGLILSFVSTTGSKVQGRLMRVNDLLRMEFLAECLGKRPAFLVQDKPFEPSSSTILPQRHFVLSKILAPVRRAIAIRSSSGLCTFPTLSIVNTSDQETVWLSCATSSRQWFLGLLVFSRVLSESLLARSSQTAFIPFCSGDESWCSDQASVSPFTSP